MIRTRANYWSCSKFADWVRKTFGGIEKPVAATMGEWAQWKKESKARSRFVYWLTEEAFNKVQNFLYWPFDVLDAARYYVKNRFFDRLHYLPTRLKPGQFYELDTRILHGLFESLVDFVEIEKAHMQLWSHKEESKKVIRYRWRFLRWKSFRSAELGMKYLEWEATLDSPELGPYEASPLQAQAAREIIALYKWWKEVRPTRPDPFDVSGWSEHCAKRRGEGDSLWIEDETDEEREETRATLQATTDIEEMYEREDEQMIIRLIKIRKQLWT